jgi:hypothetical protein
VVPLLATFGGLHYSGYRITWEDGGPCSAPTTESTAQLDGPAAVPQRSDAAHRRAHLHVRLNGKHYQDIGWIQGKDIYWVSNTLFDNLSNDTMLGWPSPPRRSSGRSNPRAGGPSG